MAKQVKVVPTPPSPGPSIKDKVAEKAKAKTEQVADKQITNKKAK